MMGKKKEISVTILADSSTKTAEIQSPRKRGRPRKVVQQVQQDEESSKKMKAIDGEEISKGDKEKRLEDIKEEVEGSSLNLEKEEGKSEKDEESSNLQQQVVPRRSSRARRKSKPRKTS